MLLQAPADTHTLAQSKRLSGQGRSNATLWIIPLKVGLFSLSHSAALDYVLSVSCASCCVLFPQSDALRKKANNKSLSACIIHSSREQQCCFCKSSRQLSHSRAKLQQLIFVSPSRKKNLSALIATASHCVDFCHCERIAIHIHFALRHSVLHQGWLLFEVCEQRIKCKFFCMFRLSTPSFEEVTYKVCKCLQNASTMIFKYINHSAENQYWYENFRRLCEDVD